ncbi:MAG: hypothetical protein JWQ42_272 [Edaphobacter sp.]|nr:hypothetical protein [Edaphobacter sp.]
MASLLCGAVRLQVHCIQQSCLPRRKGSPEWRLLSSTCVLVNAGHLRRVVIPLSHRRNNPGLGSPRSQISNSGEAIYDN